MYTRRPETAINSGGSRHSAGGGIKCFSVSHVYFFVGGGPKSVATLDGEPWPDWLLQLDPPLAIKGCLFYRSAFHSAKKLERMLKKHARLKANNADTCAQSITRRSTCLIERLPTDDHRTRFINLQIMSIVT